MSDRVETIERAHRRSERDETRQPGGGAETTRNLDLTVEGMTCASCVARVEKGLRKEEGVEEVAVNLATNRARIKARAGTDLQRLIDRVERTGYSATEYQPGERQPDQAAIEAARLRRRVWLALPLAAIVLLLAMAPMVFPGLGEVLAPVSQEVLIAQFLLTTLLLAVPARHFFLLAGRGARHLTADMNTLVAIGTGAAWLFSSVVLFWPEALPGVSSHDVYFETAAVVAALVLLGRWLEARARGRAVEAIRGLAELTPEIAHRVARAGEDVSDEQTVRNVEIEFVRPEDLLRVLPGERIPVDGKVRTGPAVVDESAMTGESLPVEKSSGDTVLAGTLNSGSSFTMLATGVGEETAIARMRQIVEEAQASKPAVQRLADKIAGVFVPIVLVIALGTFIGWITLGGVGLAAALVPAIAVLVIACPCAMGLAVPSAVISATGRAAERGILVRNVDALETASAIDHIVFDKTGTLTEGALRVVRVDLFGGRSESEVELLRIAGAVESRSEHPIARAIVAETERRGIDIPDVRHDRATAGIGIEAEVEGRLVRVGRFEQSGTPQDQPDAPAGASPIAVSDGNGPLGVIYVADTLRSIAKQTIRDLGDLGISSQMLTGDARSTALAVAEEIGIDEVTAEVMPEEKVEVVRRAAEHGKVAMVGDGVNDAPALAVADVGFALSSGSDIAVSAADITLVGGDIERVPEAIRLARRTMRIIRQNLFWAFIYNVIGIPLASAGLLNPIIAGAAMALSSVSVVSNSLRLKSSNSGK